MKNHLGFTMVEGLERLWAKSPSGNGGHYLPLLAHLLDTAAVALEILRREPSSTLELYALDLGVEPGQALFLVPCLCGLHDLGKASPVFQVKWEHGAVQVKNAGFPFPVRLRRTDVRNTPHNLVTCITLRGILQNRGWPKDLSRGIAIALGSHHGFRPDNAMCSRRLVGRGPWDEARKELVNILFSVTGSGDFAGTEFLSGAGFMRLAGLTSFSDWIASNELLFPYSRPMTHPKDFLNKSLSLASLALDRIGWSPRTPLVSQVPSFTSTFGFSRPRPLQSKIQEALEKVQGPSMIVVEAPTGEGKTEAAFYAHLKFQEKIGHRGMYIGLPTQATGNQMFHRTRCFLEDVSQRETSVDLQLLHGAVLLKREFQDLKVRLEDDDREGPVVAGEWFTAKKRALLSEYGVGTIDQALMSVLNVKHQFVRMWGLGNRTIIFDEVHAYDTYTSTLIERLLAWLKALGSSVVLMSATLPSKKRDAFIRAFGGDPPLGKTSSYPRITMVSGTGEVEEISGFHIRPQSPVEIRPLPIDLEQVAEKALEAVKDGGCCLCVVNTVSRAQGLYSLLREEKERMGWDGALGIFHSRYTAFRKKDLEEQVLELYGPGGNRPFKSVLVATQVVEQSLDLDFDVMFSDLAPVDLLLQRAGRLHRHSRQRSAQHKVPRLFVMGLDETLPVLREELSSTGMDKVYDPCILLRTYGILKEIDRFQYPTAYDHLIEAVYGDTWMPDRELSASIETEKEKLRIAEEEQRSLAEKLAIEVPRRFLKTDASAFKQLEDDDPAVHPELRAITRLGQPAIDVVILHRQPDGSLSLDTEGKRPVDLDSPVNDLDDAVRIYMNKVTVSHPAIYHRLKGPQNVPEYWRKEPLLRHLRCLILEDGVADFRGWRCEYSDELGMSIVKYSPETNGMEQNNVQK